MKKRTLTIILTYSAALFAVACGFAVKYHREAAVYRRAELYGGYMTMSELADAAESISRAFDESVYAYSPAVLAQAANAVWRSSAGAVEALSRLPLYDAQMENTRGFISRAGDYAAFLARAAAGDGLDEGEREKMGEMAKAAQTLSESLRSVESDIYAGNLLFSGAVFTSDGAMLRFNDIEKAASYPSFDYDGLLSESYMTRTPAALDGAENCPKEDAAALAAKALACDEGALCYAGESGGRINCHMFTCGGDEAYITCLGGHILSLRRTSASDNTDEAQEAAMVQDAPEYDKGRLEALASKALEELGYAGMTADRIIMTEDGIEGSFVCCENGVVCCPDAVYAAFSPVKGVTLLNASSYILNHHARDAEAVPTGAEGDILPPDIRLSLEGLCVIENGYGGESLCRVYTGGDADGRTVKIYCNAQTGAQEKIEIE